MIRLTFVTDNVRGEPLEVETDDLREALRVAADHWFPESHSDDVAALRAWCFTLVVERGDARLTREDVAERLDRCAQLELCRAAR